MNFPIDQRTVRVTTYSACLFALPAVLLIASSAHAGPITYETAVISLTGGHSLTGSITTDGTTGSLVAANILAWDFSIAGPTPFQISSASASKFVGPANVSATVSEITIDPAPGSLSFTVNDGTSVNPNCVPQCFASVSWQDDGVSPFIQATVADSGDFSPFAFLTGALSSPFVIATSNVPEPTSILLALAGLTMFGRRRWWC